MKKNTENALVSVIITTYNREDMLERACHSVFKQDYDNIEIIIIDDNSPICIKDKVNELSNISPYPIKYLKNKENKGACFSRNLGISEANGYFITGLDDDDEYTSDRISHFVNNYDSKYSFLSSNSNVITSKGQSNLYVSKENVVVTLNDILWANTCGTQIFIERERFVQTDGFDLSLTSSQDADMWLRLIEIYGPALRLGKPTFILHTEHEGGRISDNKIQGMEAMLSKHRSKMTSSQIKYRQFKIAYKKKKTNLLMKSYLLFDFKVIAFLTRKFMLNSI